MWFLLVLGGWRGGFSLSWVAGSIFSSFLLVLLDGVGFSVCGLDSAFRAGQAWFRGWGGGYRLGLTCVIPGAWSPWWLADTAFKLGRSAGCIIGRSVASFRVLISGLGAEQGFRLGNI